MRAFDLFRLIRLPNLPTAVADGLAGFWLARARDASWGDDALAWILATSLCLYTAGMVLNDVFDLETDRQERPERPLPSGAVPRRFAVVLGIGLLVLGLAASAFAGPGSLIIGLGLAAFVVAYDMGAKATAWGPVVMGSCRGLNLLLGMTAGGWPHAMTNGVGYAVALFGFVLGHTIYVSGLTAFARHEAGQSSHTSLIGAWRLMAAGVGVDAMAVVGAAWGFRGTPAASRAHAIGTDFDLPLGPQPLLALALLGLLGFGLRVLLLPALRQPEPKFVQQGVKAAIFGLVLLDATLVLALVDGLRAAIIAFLIVPALWLGRWMYAT